MDWTHNIFGLIDMRSFSNVWFWIVLSLLWSSLSHYVMGVPFDMVTRARRQGGAAMEDLEAVVRAQVNRRVHIAEVSGQWLVAVTAAALTMLALLGFLYGLQFGQALFLLLAPTAVVGVMSVTTARRLHADPLTGEALCALLGRQRFQVQLLGVLTIFVTALWGIYRLMTASVLGHG